MKLNLGKRVDLRKTVMRRSLFRTLRVNLGVSLESVLYNSLRISLRHSLQNGLYDSLRESDQ